LIMSDWEHIIRAHLSPLELPPEREMEIAEELAQHLEAVYEEALSAGAAVQKARRRAMQAIADGHLLECEIGRVERPLRRPQLLPGSAVEDLEPKGRMRMESLWQGLLSCGRVLVE